MMFRVVVCVFRVVARTSLCSCCGVQADAMVLLRVCWSVLRDCQASAIVFWVVASVLLRCSSGCNEVVNVFRVFARPVYDVQGSC